MAFPFAARAWSRGRNGLRTAARPGRAEITRVLESLGEHLDAVEWGARRVAASRDPALARILESFVEGERAGARAALEALRSLDPRLARDLTRRLLRSELQGGWRALAGRAGLLHGALMRAVRRTSATADPSVRGRLEPQDGYAPTLEKP